MYNHSEACISTNTLILYGLNTAQAQICIIPFQARKLPVERYGRYFTTL